jgi:DNA polymerase/3'-5' exonuclease PolX
LQPTRPSLFPDLSQEKPTFPLSQAQPIAEALAEQLRANARVEIAGSIRRVQPYVHDIEIVAEPKLSWDDANFSAQLSKLASRGELTPRRAGGKLALGPRYQRWAFGGVPIDLFIVLPPAQWGVIFTIRTGPASFSKRVVTPTSKGGLLPPHYTVRTGAIYRPGYGPGPLNTPEESDFFAILTTPYIEPKDRR